MYDAWPSSDGQNSTTDRQARAAGSLKEPVLAQACEWLKVYLRSVERRRYIMHQIYASTFAHKKMFIIAKQSLAIFILTLVALVSQRKRSGFWILWGH